METKKPWHSKTVIMNFVLAAAAFWPPALQYITENPQITALGWGLVNVALRLITKGKVEVS